MADKSEETNPTRLKVSLLDQLIRLKEMRAYAGLSQMQMARHLLTSQANVVRLEKHPQTATASQLDAWLTECGFSDSFYGRYLSVLERIEPNPIREFLISADNILRAAGIPPQLHRKPLLAVMGNRLEDQSLTVAVVRTLLQGGLRAVPGLLMPSPEVTLLVKHTSERPPGCYESAHLLPESLNPVSLISPTDFTSADLSESRARRGAVLFMEEGEAASNARTAVLYADHPILMCVDIVRPGFGPDSDQGYFDLETAASAAITILCISRALSIRGLILTLVNTQSVRFAATTIGNTPRSYLDLLSGAGDLEPVEFPFTDALAPTPGAVKALGEIASNALVMRSSWLYSHGLALRHGRIPLEPAGRGPIADRLRRISRLSPLTEFVTQKLLAAESTGQRDFLAEAYRLLSALESDDTSRSVRERTAEEYQKLYTTWIGKNEIAIPRAPSLEILPADIRTMLRDLWVRTSMDQARKT